ncbi:MAG: hypothetical protein M0P26_01065 [Bacteroidales bacterium]|nr:hypothetical protein [Bacteroidales bacterium]
MINQDLSTSVEKAAISTGRWYTVGRINVCAQTSREVPWASGTQVVIVYDEERDEMRIKPLRY